MIKLTKEISSLQLEWRNDPRIYQFTRQNGILSEADMMKWRAKIDSDPTIQMFGVEAYAEDFNAYYEIGTAGLTDISYFHGTAEFSLLIGPKHQRQGFGKEALIELLKYGFKHLRLKTIWGETFVNNPAYKMFLSIGMKHEGTVRQRYFKNGEYTDCHIVSILEEEARAQAWFHPKN